MLLQTDRQTDRQTELTGYPSIDKPWLKYYDKEFLKQPIPSMNIYAYLKTMTANYGRLTALSYYGKKITYQILFDHIDRTAEVLSNVGVKSGDRIMYLMPNIPETAYFLYAGAKIGAVADFVDPRPDSVDSAVSARKILAMIKEEKISFLISLDLCYLAMLQPVEKELKGLGIEQIILASAADFMNGGNKLNYLYEKFNFNGLSALSEYLKKSKHTSQLLNEARKKSVLKLLDYKYLINKVHGTGCTEAGYEKDQLAVIVHTSGTSSARPKPIPLTHDNLNFYVHQTFAANMPMSVGDKALHMLPYFAAFGIVGVVHAGLCHGNNLIQIPEFVTCNLGKMIRKYRPQTVIGAPSWFMGLTKDKTLNNVDLSFLTMMTFGGDSMSEADENKINDFLKAHKSGCLMTKGHGMSETCGCASYATGLYNIPASVGIPMPLTTYAVVDSETKAPLKFEGTEEYLEGELIISSGAVTPGTLDDNVIVPKKEYFGESYILTRDIARMDRNGIMTFLARSDRSITRFDGYKIKPYEVEHTVCGYPEVQYCVISSVYNKEKFGNVTVADIVLTEGKIPERKAQIKIIEELVQTQFVGNEEVSSRQIPMWFRFRENLPLTVNGKVNYHDLADEPLTGKEICVEIEENNISIEKIIIK